jgi:hypothetical protein
MSYKVIHYVVRLLRNRNITQYIENYPTAYSEVLAAVQEIIVNAILISYLR